MAAVVAQARRMICVPATPFRAILNANYHATSGAKATRRKNRGYKGVFLNAESLDEVGAHLLATATTPTTRSTSGRNIFLLGKLYAATRRVLRLPNSDAMGYSSTRTSWV